METGILEKIFLRGTLTTLTGLRIGGTDQGLGVGGLQNIAIRHALLNEPYVPGSSLRGKMRCLLERLAGLSGKGHGDMILFGPADQPEEWLVQLFGNAAEKSAAIPSRVAVRDALLTPESREKLRMLRGDLPMTETKTEVCIDRVTSAANPRTFERVPAGATFEFEIVLDVRALPEADPPKASDDLKKTLQVQRDKRHRPNGWGRDIDLAWILTGLDLLQDDALGGQGSRGYGRVKIMVETPKIRTREDYQEGRAEKDLKLADGLQKRIESINARGANERVKIEDALRALEGTS